MYNGFYLKDSIVKTRYSVIGTLYTYSIPRETLYTVIYARNDFPYDVMIRYISEDGDCIRYEVYAISGKFMVSATKQFMVFLKRLCKHENYEGRISFLIFNPTLKNFKYEDHIATKTEKKLGSIVGEMIDLKRQLDQLNEKFDKIQSIIDTLC